MKDGRQASTRTFLPKVTLWPRDGGPKMDLGAQVVKVDATETLMSQGCFTLALAPDARRIDRLANLSRRVRSQALIAIGLEKPGGIMLGLVDSVTEDKIRSGPMLTYTYVIVGTHVVWKALTRDNILLSMLTEEAAAPFFDHMKKVLGEGHPITLALQSALGPTDDEGANVFTGRTVAEVVDWAVTQIPMMVFPALAHAAGGSGHIGEYLDTSKSVTTWNDQRIFSEHPQEYSGSLLGFIHSVLDVDFYEVFATTLPNDTELPGLALVVRPKPFDDPELEVAPVAEETGLTWPDLRTIVEDLDAHEITDRMIYRQTTTRSDGDAYAYYTVTSNHELIGNDQQHQEGLRYPLIDTYILTTYGAQAMTPSLQLVSPDFDAKAAGEVDLESEVPSAVREFRNRLFNWYRFRPWMESGSITVEGKDSYRAGDPIMLVDHHHAYGDPKRPGMRAYIVAVSWSWQLQGEYTCSIRFERGYNPDVIKAAKDEIAKDAARYGVPASHYADS